VHFNADIVILIWTQVAIVLKFLGGGSKTVVLF